MLIIVLIFIVVLFFLNNMGLMGIIGFIGLLGDLIEFLAEVFPALGFLIDELFDTGIFRDDSHI